MFAKMLDKVKTVFKKGLIYILAGSFMTKLVSMFGSIFLVRVLSKQEYGVLGYLDNIYGYVLVFAGMGMANVVLRYVVLGKTQQEKYNYFSFSFRRALIWNIGLFVLASLLFAVYPHKEDYKSYAWLLGIMFLMLPMQNITEITLCNERAMFSNQRYAVFSLILSTSIIVTKIIAGLLGGIYAVVFAQLAVYSVMAILLYSTTKKHYYRKFFPQALSRQETTAASKYAIQYMITNGLWAVFMLNDTFLLGRFCDPTVLADYRVAYTIPGCINIISGAIGIFIAPYFVKHEQDTPWVRKNFKYVYIVSAVIIGVVCLGIAVLAKPIIWLLYGEQYLNTSSVMQMLLLAAFFNCGMRYTTANLLAAMGQVKYNMMISGIGMILQIALNIYIIPRFGAMGVAGTSCVVYLFMALTLLGIFIKKYYRMKSITE